MKLNNNYTIRIVEMNYVKVRDQDDIIESLPEGNDSLVDLLEDYGYLNVYQVEKRLHHDISLLEKYSHKASLSQQILIAISNNCHFIDNKITRLYYIIKSTSERVKINDIYLSLNYYSSFFTIDNERILLVLYNYVDRILRYEFARDIICYGVDKETADDAMRLLPNLRYFIKKGTMYIRTNNLRDYLSNGRW